MPGHSASRDFDNQFELRHNNQRRTYLPKFAGSPFGDFPADYMMPAQKKALLDGPSAQAQAKMASRAQSTNEFAGAAKGAGGLGDRTTKKKVHHKFLKAHSQHFGCALNHKVEVERTQADRAAQSLGSESPMQARDLIAKQNPATMFDGPPQAPKRNPAFKRQKIPPTEFRRFYERGDLPVTIMHHGNGRRLKWGAQIQDLDFHHYLPIFFDGLRELEEPYKFVALQGCFDLIAAGSNKVLACVPQLIIPMKIALNSKDPEIICTVLRVLQRLVTSAELVGEALVPYYRQILPVLNLFSGVNCNLGDRQDFSSGKGKNIGDLIHETLQLLERYGGDDAFVNIKFLVPTYESCVLN